MAAPASTTDHVAEVPKQNKDKVYIGNLGYKTTEEAVREFVASAGGNITSVVIPLRFGKRPAGFALVTYEKEADAQNAVDKLQDKELDGRKLRVQLSRSDEEVAELNEKRQAARDAKKAADKEAKQAAAAERAAAGETGGEVAGEGEAAKKLKKKSNKSRTARRRVPGEDGEETEDAAATDAVEGEAAEDAAKPKSKRKPKAKKAAAAASEARIDGGETTEAEVKEKPVREKKERKPREKKLAPSGEESKDTLFVSNLPYDIDDDALASIFTNLSIEIKSAKVIRSTFNRYRGKKPIAEQAERTPRSRGFGFVEVANPAQRDEAVEKAAGTLIASREIGVKVAKEMQAINGAAEGKEEELTQDTSNIQATPEKGTA